MKRREFITVTPAMLGTSLMWSPPVELKAAEQNTDIGVMPPSENTDILAGATTEEAFEMGYQWCWIKQQCRRISLGQLGASLFITNPKLQPRIENVAATYDVDVSFSRQQNGLLSCMLKGRYTLRHHSLEVCGEIEATGDRLQAVREVTRVQGGPIIGAEGGFISTFNSES